MAAQIRKIERILRQRLETGEYAAGSTFPTQADLCKEFAAHTQTVARAMDTLTAAGFLTERVVRQPRAVCDPIPARTPRPPLASLTGRNDEVAHALRSHIHLGRWRRGDLYSVSDLWDQHVGDAGTVVDLKLILSHLREQHLIEYQPPLGWRLDVAGTRWKPPGGGHVADYIVGELRRRFHDGHYKAGQHLDVRRLAWAFSVPQPDFRRVALQTLVTDGLIVSRAHVYAATGKDAPPPAPDAGRHFQAESTPDTPKHP